MTDSHITTQTNPEAPRPEALETRASFEEPKLSFIEPKLTKHGDATKITQQNGFFGTFMP
jgi:hypothetical protein